MGSRGLESLKVFLSQLHREEEEEEGSLGYKRLIRERKKKRKKTESWGVLTY